MLDIILDHLVHQYNDKSIILSSFSHEELKYHFY